MNEKALTVEEIDSIGDCRFYENEHPEVEDLVIVRVDRITSLGVYGTLLEYDGCEGMIILSELSKRRFRTVNKLVKVGREEVVMVLKVDEAKGYVDLSKRRVSPKDIEVCEKRYAKSKRLHHIARVIAATHQIPLIDLYKSTIWPLSKKHGHGLDALKDLLHAPEEVFGTLPIADHIKASLLHMAKTRLARGVLKMRATVRLSCSGEPGVEAIKAALRAARDAAATAPEEEASEIPEAELFKIQLGSPPDYTFAGSTLSKSVAIKRLTIAIEAAREAILKFHLGTFELTKPSIRESIIITQKEDDEEPEKEPQAEEECVEVDEGMGAADD